MVAERSLFGAMVHAFDPSTEEGKRMIDWLCEVTILGAVGARWPKPRLVVNNTLEEEED